MKVAVLLLTIFLCFPAVNGFCADTNTPAEQSFQADYLIPFTSEIFDLLYGAVVYLERLDYYLSAPIGIVLEPPPKQEDVLRIANGALLFDQYAASLVSHEIVVNGDACGKLKSFFGTPKGSEIFEIEFGEPGKKCLLQFRRNTQNDLFELFSVFDVSAEKNYLLRPDSIVPYLLIKSDRNGVIKMPAAPVPIGDTSMQSPQSAPTALPPQSPSSQPLLSFPVQSAPAYTAPDYIPPPGSPSSSSAAQSVAQPSSSPAASAGTYSHNDILKSGSLSKSAIVAFVRSRNPKVDTAQLSALIDVYIAEAGSEQINYDFAIAQMCYATNFLHNEDRMLVHDYAALGRPLSRTGDYSRDMVIGVRAHIQHLKGYASSENPRQKIEDPRFDVIIRSGIRGKITTFDELYKKWAPLSPDYGANISGILREMARF